MGNIHAIGLCEGIPPAKLGFFDIGQVDGHPLTGIGLLDGMGVHLEVADLGDPSFGIDHDIRPLLHLPLGKGSGDDGAKAVDGKDPVDGQAEGNFKVFRRSQGGLTGDLPSAPRRRGWAHPPEKCP